MDYEYYEPSIPADFDLYQGSDVIDLFPEPLGYSRNNTILEGDSSMWPLPNRMEDPVQSCNVHTLLRLRHSYICSWILERLVKSHLSR